MPRAQLLGKIWGIPSMAYGCCSGSKLLPAVHSVFAMYCLSENSQSFENPQGLGSIRDSISSNIRMP